MSYVNISESLSAKQMLFHTPEAQTDGCKAPIAARVSLTDAVVLHVQIMKRRKFPSQPARVLLPQQKLLCHGGFGNRSASPSPVSSRSQLVTTLSLRPVFKTR
jgi:hypothetical protein